MIEWGGDAEAKPRAIQEKVKGQQYLQPSEKKDLLERLLRFSDDSFQ